MEYGVKARFVSILVEFVYTDSMKSFDSPFKDADVELLHLNLTGAALSFAVSSLPLFWVSG